jgi:hypothetical protein
MSAKEAKRIKALMEQYADVIAATRRELAFLPGLGAQRVIAHGCAHIGCSRLDWEKISFLKDPENDPADFKAPPAKLLRRWECA